MNWQYWLTLAFAILSSWWLVSTVVFLVKAQIATAWPSATGRIQSFRAKEGGKYDSAFGYSKPHVVYSYEVSGRQYVNDRLSFGPDVYQSGPDKRVDQYRPHAEVTVFYDPLHPNRSVLVRGVHQRFFLHIVVAAAFLWAVLYTMSA